MSDFIVSNNVGGDSEEEAWVPDPLVDIDSSNIMSSKVGLKAMCAVRYKHYIACL